MAHAPLGGAELLEQLGVILQQSHEHSAMTRPILSGPPATAQPPLQPFGVFASMMISSTVIWPSRLVSPAEQPTVGVSQGNVHRGDQLGTADNMSAKLIASDPCLTCYLVRLGPDRD